MEGMFGVLGFSFSGSGQNQVLVFVKLKDWEERRRPEQKVKAIQGRAMAKFMQFKDAFAFAFAPPAALELGNATGFDVRLVDRAGLGHDALMGARNQLLGMSMQNPVADQGAPQWPRRHARVSDRYRPGESERAGPFAGRHQRLARAPSWGSTYVNDFIDKGRVKKVFVQGDAPFRMLPEDVSHWYLRNAQNGMVPFSAFSTAEWTLGSPKLERFNGSPSVSDPRRTRARPQLRRGDARDRANGEGPASGHRHRVGRAFLRRAALRLEIHRALHHRAAHGLPLPRRAL